MYINVYQWISPPLTEDGVNGILYVIVHCRVRLKSSVRSDEIEAQ